MLTALVLAFVVGVSDGDTVTALTHDKKEIKVRLAGIDAPEKKQPFGQRSKQSLSNLVFAREVDLRCGKVDRYKRSICSITVDGLDANLQQIRNGMAWHYKAYAKEQPPDEALLYAAEELTAKRKNIGLWQDPNHTPPWRWRKTPK